MSHRAKVGFGKYINKRCYYEERYSSRNHLPMSFLTLSVDYAVFLLYMVNFLFNVRGLADYLD